MTSSPKTSRDEAPPLPRRGEARTGSPVRSGKPGPAPPLAGPGPKTPARGARRRQAEGSAPLAGSSQIAARMSEAELEENIRALCKDLGIIRFHVRDSRGTNAGLPDDILIGARGVLWRECKSERGRLTPAQLEAGLALGDAGQDWDVWRPSSLLSGQIARELAAIAGIGAAA